MKRTFTILLAAALLGLPALAQTAAGSLTPVVKETIAFAEKGGRTLYLDKYETASPESAEPRPVVLFAFGGGFYTGDRAYEGHMPYFEFLARNGFVVLSTDYRTMLKELDTDSIKSPVDFLEVLQGAIDTAVVDFCDAARFAVEHADEWNIDPSLIVASGSSAGAITALQAEYDICNGRYTVARLPEGFNFAGVVSFAGAISSKKKLDWNSSPCPIMLFHGNADTTVPYRKAHIAGLGGLWGSASIVKSLERIDSPYDFHIVANASHEIACIPMKHNLHDIMAFLSRQVLGEKPLAVTTVEAAPGAPTKEKRFTILDYLRTNTRR